MSVIDDISRFLDCDFVFSVTGTTTISGMNKMLKRIQARSGTSSWRLHDLRRTVASGMARALLAPDIVEKVLNHVSEIISGIAAV
ncbi:tyrosine-type recombinase/integrase [Parasphingorhabdus cellanae]|uniref:Tyrosine-type recombinase/integrase n=1 Tax=Parasphingorhabdus cellanae TaxID=2806553 RepID=A0ABX7T5D2_9SPHN|nr:tyrosine-type recombinase/integrase [Parasphingorhabdus cellanae]